MSVTIAGARAIGETTAIATAMATASTAAAFGTWATPTSTAPETGRACLATAPTPSRLAGTRPIGRFALPVVVAGLHHSPVVHASSGAGVARAWGVPPMTKRTIVARRTGVPFVAVAVPRRHGTRTVVVAGSTGPARAFGHHPRSDGPSQQQRLALRQDVVALLARARVADAASAVGVAHFVRRRRAGAGHCPGLALGATPSLVARAGASARVDHQTVLHTGSVVVADLDRVAAGRHDVLALNGTITARIPSLAGGAGCSGVVSRAAASSRARLGACSIAFPVPVASAVRAARSPLVVRTNLFAAIQRRPTSVASAVTGEKLQGTVVATRYAHHHARDAWVQTRSQHAVTRGSVPGHVAVASVASAARPTQIASTSSVVGHAVVAGTMRATHHRAWGARSTVVARCALVAIRSVKPRCTNAGTRPG